MTERVPVDGYGPTDSGRRAGLYLTAAAAIFVLLLALGALLWPADHRMAAEGKVVVFDPTGDLSRVENLYRPLVAFLEQVSGQSLGLVTVRTREAFLAGAGPEAAFLLCPDGLALQLPHGDFYPVVNARRAAPRNLRPRGVLVYRKSAGLVDEPWRSRPGRTVVGDSLSLAACAAVLAGARPGDLRCHWGPDPYDHAPVLHAARLGAFDYACVRQWDADRFLAEGLLSGTEWGVATMSDPVPDLVLLASLRVPRADRLLVGESLSRLARTQEPATAAQERLLGGMPLLRLAGFNLLLEPDFERVRGIFSRHWHPAAD